MDKDSIGFKLTRMYANMSLPEQTLTKMVREKRNVLCKVHVFEIVESIAYSMIVLGITMGLEFETEYRGAGEFFDG